MKKIMLAVATFALTAFAASNTFHVTFDEAAWISGTQVKAGDYMCRWKETKLSSSPERPSLRRRPSWKRLSINSVPLAS